MLRTYALLLVAAASCGGCATVRDVVSPPGDMNADGTINPCHGHKADVQACGNAQYNGARIGKVTIGQSLRRGSADHGSRS